MNFSFYLKTILTYSYIPILLVVIFLAAAWLDYSSVPTNYSGSVTFTSGNKKGGESVVNFDNFYALSATSNLAETVEGWLKSPNIVADIFSKSGKSTEGLRITNLSRAVKPQKTSLNSGVVIATYEGSNRDEVEKVLSNTKSVVNEYFTTLQNNNQIPSELSLAITDPIVIDQPKNIVFNSLIAIFAGIVIGIMLVFVAAGFKSSK